MALIEIDVFPSERNLHLWLGFSMAMLNNQMVGDEILDGTRSRAIALS
jgi:hypothetical protein